MKNTFYPIENRTRDLPACSTVPQLTTPHRTSAQCNKIVNLNHEMESNSTLNGLAMPCDKKLSQYLSVRTVEYDDEFVRDHFEDLRQVGRTAMKLMLEKSGRRVNSFNTSHSL